jgi:hypothetical protein
MVKAGWATTYVQSGAEYGAVGKEEFLRTEAYAKYVPGTRANFHILTYLTRRLVRRGMWKKGTSKVETPAEYKKRYRAEDAVAPVTIKPASTLLSWFWGKRA